MPDDKTIILVRHAESTNNVAKRTLKRTLSGAWPDASRGEWSQLASLLTFPMDTPLSSDGEAMLAAQRKELDTSGLVAAEKLELVLHSPLRRARETAVALFGSSGTVPLREEPTIFEKDLAEHAGLSSLRRRTAAFTAALLALPERRVAVVGHSAFFRDLQFAADERSFDKKQLLNVSVWRATLGAADGRWRGLELLLPGWPRPSPALPLSERDMEDISSIES